MNFTVTDQKTIVELPSASGIVHYNGFYYVVGDDTPFLFKLNQEFEVVEKYVIYLPVDTLKNGRIPKSVKPDFEGLEMISEGIFMVIGSGSKSPQRDHLSIIDTNNGFSVRPYPLTGFYKAFQKMEIMKGSELNVEAIAYANDILFIFNRKKNVIFKMDYNALISYLSDAKPLPAIESVPYHLPQLNGIEAGFSGATFYEKENVMLVTASVENTDNAYDDGEVLGSFVGILSLTSSDYSIRWHTINSKGAALKIESITVNRALENKALEVILVADNDDGKSTFLKGRLDW